MRRILIAVFVIFVAWIALKDWGYSTFLGKAEVTPEQPDYFYTEVWLERPEDMPPGGWESPWGIDLFVVAPPVSTPVRKGLVPAESEEMAADYARFAEAAGLTASEATIYAPAYRSPSPGSGANARKEQMLAAQSDIIAALRRYLSADNRSRGLIILAAPGSEPLAESVVEALPQEADFRDRFGGILLPAGADPADWTTKASPCSPAFEDCVVVTSISGQAPVISWLLPGLAHRKQAYSAESDPASTIETRAQTLANWLDLNAEKPAEPFDTWAADEVVDVAPIIRPNQEEDISGERGD